MPIEIVTSRGPILISDRVADMHPEEWFRDVYEQAPRRTAPLTAVLDMMKPKTSRSYAFHYWEEGYDAQNIEVADSYNDPQLSTATSTGSASGSIRYLKTNSANDAKRFTNGQLGFVSSTATGDGLAKPTLLPVRITGGTALTDSTSYVTVQTQAVDTNDVLAQSGLGLTIISNSQAELTELPDPQFWDKVQRDNYTQQMMASWAFSNREEYELSRTEGDITAETMRKAIKKLNEQREFSKIFGTKSSSGGQGKTESGGIYEYISTYAPDNVLDFYTDTDASGMTFEEYWLDWFREKFLSASRYNDTGKVLGFCGDVAHNAICKAVRKDGWLQVTTQTRDWGIKVTTIHGLSCDLGLITHPRFSTNRRLRRSMLVTDPTLLTRVVRDGGGMSMIPTGDAGESGWTFVTGKKGGAYIDEGLQVNNADAHMWIDNIGLDNQNA
jgi:hypothetical protein